MNTLVYIAQKYGIDLQQKHLPIEIPTIGRDHLAELFCELGYKTLQNRKMHGIVKAYDIPFWGRAEEVMKLHHV